MTRARRFGLSLALAFAFLQAPAFAEEPVFELPPSDESSLTEFLPEETPFKLRCQDAATHNKQLHDLKAKGMIIGTDLGDGTLVMVFRFLDGSLQFARSDRQGTLVCIFGSVGEPDIDLGVVLQDGSKVQTD
jgi:hypothetical protein